MKTLKYLFGVLLLMFVFFGCQKDELNPTGDQDNATLGKSLFKNGVVVNYCGDPMVTELLADQDLEVGSVTVGNDDEYLYVTFTTTGDWFMSNTKVWVGTNPAKIPVTKTGNPIRGKFTVDVNHDPLLQSQTYAFALESIAEGLEPGDAVVVAAHADVQMEYMEGDLLMIRKETAWGFGDGTFSGKAWGWYMTFTLQECPECPDHVIVFKDADAWSFNNNDDALENLGFTAGTGPGTYEFASSADMGVKTLNPATDLVIIVSDQPQSFYDAMATNLTYFLNFVQAGGRMIWGACDQGYNYGSQLVAGIVFPSGITYTNVYTSYNLIPDPTLPLVAGLPTTLYGSSPSHVSFDNLPVGSIIYCTDENEKPTLFEMAYGNGLILITGQTWEFYDYLTDQFPGVSVGPLLKRSYAYMTCKEIPTEMKAAAVKSDALLSTHK